MRVCAVRNARTACGRTTIYAYCRVGSISPDRARPLPARPLAPPVALLRGQPGERALAGGGLAARTLTPACGASWLGYCRSVAGVPDNEGVLAAIDDFGNCLAAQDLSGTLALLADDPDVTVIPSEGAEAHHGREAVASFFGRIYAGRRRYSWRWRDRWVSAEGAWASFVAIGDEFVDVAGAERLVIPYCLTGTLVRRDGLWRFLLLHGSEESPGS